MSKDFPTPPVWLQQWHQRLPVRFWSWHALLGLEAARKLAGLTPPAELDGRCFALTVSDWGIQVHFTCQQGRFRWSGTQAPELLLQARLADFFCLLRGEVDADTLFFQRRLQISGDTELGLMVKNWLDALERPGWLQASGV